MSELSVDLIGVIAGCAVGGFIVLVISIVIIVVCCRKSSEDRNYDDMANKYQPGSYAMSHGNSHGIYYSSQQPLWKRSVRRLKTVMGYPQEKRGQYPSQEKRGPYPPQGHAYHHQELPKTHLYHTSELPKETPRDLYPQNSLKSTGSSTKQIASSDPSAAMTSSIPRPKLKAAGQLSNATPPNSAREQNSLKREPLKNERKTQTFIERCYSRLKDTGMVKGNKPLYACLPQDYSPMNNLFEVIGTARDGSLIVRPFPGTPLRPKHMSSSKKHQVKQRSPREAEPLERKPVKRAASDREIRRVAYPASSKKVDNAAAPSFYFSGPDLSTLGRDRSQPQLQLPPAINRHPFEQSVPVKVSSSQVRKPPVEEKKSQAKNSSPVSKARLSKKSQPKAKSSNKTRSDGVARAVITSRSNQPEKGQADGQTNQAFSPAPGDDQSKERERSGSVSTLKSLGPREVAAEFSFLDHYDSGDENL